MGTATVSSMGSSSSDREVVDYGSGGGTKDGHEHDVMMPGFRFHPTEEELVEFYLRRKVEGKRFNVELITFLDLYRYDPWELPELAAIGEKEWYFYVPRDRKYRNGDRPNRVTTSGYWKATGADRMIRTETSRPIGLKKTLVFYSGKAPKGVRTSWIMNEYRLPQNETDRSHKGEISLCRVYKRAGVEDNYQIPGVLPSNKPSSSRSATSSTGSHHDKSRQHGSSSGHHQQFSTLGGLAGTESSTSSEMEKMSDACHGGSADMTTMATQQEHGAGYGATLLPMSSTSTEEGCVRIAAYIPTSSTAPQAAGPCSSPVPASATTLDELNKLLEYHHHQSYLQQTNSQILAFASPPAAPPPQLFPQLAAFPNPMGGFSDRFWEWNPIPDGGRDCSGYK